MKTLHLYDPVSDTTGEISGVPAVVHVARQTPKKSGDGHFGYRIAFDGDNLLWISSSERKEFDPAQAMDTNLGKIVRLNADGSVPDDNPFADQGDVAAQIWSLGHRNILGLTFDADGQLRAQEMGPLGGDELNRIERGANYGYPIVSNGDHYDGTAIPNHDTHPEFRAPVITWNPVISPAGLMIYAGGLLPSSQALRSPCANPSRSCHAAMLSSGYSSKHWSCRSALTSTQFALLPSIRWVRSGGFGRSVSIADAKGCMSSGQRWS